MYLNNIIAEAENKWFSLLYNFCKEQFNGRLISHDHTHHLRVWKTTCAIVKQTPTPCFFDKTKIELLMFAVFFHDMGMIDTIDPRHGKLSRNYCNDFLNLHTDFDPDSKKLVLDAVEYHDDKSYSQSTKPNTLLSILNIADDADAFGAIGVYRYSEIWVLRGYSVFEMPETIVPNLQRRFENLQASTLLTKHFIKKQEQRYLFTQHFFLSMKKQIATSGARHKTTGPLSIIRFFNDNIMEKSIEFNDISQNAYPVDDEYSKKYFEQLHQEISTTI
jgi:HD superfamily phosphodiesterase